MAKWEMKQRSVVNTISPEIAILLLQLTCTNEALSGNPCCINANHPYIINININIWTIELKWDGKITKMRYDNEMRWKRITVWNGGDL